MLELINSQEIKNGMITKGPFTRNYSMDSNIYAVSSSNYENNIENKYNIMLNETPGDSLVRVERQDNRHILLYYHLASRKIEYNFIDNRHHFRDEHYKTKISVFVPDCVFKLSLGIVNNLFSLNHAHVAWDGQKYSMPVPNFYIPERYRGADVSNVCLGYIKRHWDSKVYPKQLALYILEADGNHDLSMNFSNNRNIQTRIAIPFLSKNTFNSLDEQEEAFKKLL